MHESDRLPYVDEHSVAIEAGVDVVWDALLRVTEGSFASTASSRGARLLGCADVEVSGPRPLSVGSTIPGFHVSVADPHRELALLGRHRFSKYALTFRLEGDGSRSRLRAETRASFPGIAGRAYRVAVIGTRLHVLVTRRLLDAMKRRAEAG